MRFNHAADALSYRITSLPTHGTLKYDGVAITSASAGSPFIVADLSKLTYSHDGSEPTGTPSPRPPGISAASKV